MAELIDFIATALERFGPQGWPILGIVYFVLRERVHESDKRTLQSKLFDEIEVRERGAERTRGLLENILDAMRHHA